MGIRRKILVCFPIFLIAAYAVLHSAQFSFAQTDIPSDLSLDLGLAQQNPAPEQKQIVQAEIKQAVVTSTKGETLTVTPQDSVSQQAKTESSQDAINPEETTSEQVVTKPIPVVVDEKGSPVPSATDQGSPSPDANTPSSSTNNDNPSSSNNTNSSNPSSSPIPGTSIPEHNDNAAPSDNSTNPNLPAPSEPTPADNSDNPAVEGTKTKSGSIFQKVIAKAFSIFNR